MGGADLDTCDLTVLMGWAEAAAEAAALPLDPSSVVADAATGAPWRRDLGLPDPSPALAAALRDLVTGRDLAGRLLRTATDARRRR